MNCKKKYFVLFLAIVMSISVLNTDVFAKSKSEGWKLNNKGKSQAKNMQHEEAVKTFEQLKDVWKSFDWNADPDMEQEYMIADRNAEQLRTYSDVYVERNASGNTKNFTNAKLEPKVGCYLGALAPHEQTLYGATYFREFPALVGKDLAGYLIYMNYGDNIETFRTHFQEAKNNDCSIELALEPNSGLDMVQDDETLRTFARKLNEFDAPVFLRFANEMNDTGNAWHLEGPEKYKEKFKIVANVIHEEAPKVAMVWAPNNFPFTKIDMYYPGDEYVDWVGLSIYAVNQPEVDPMDQGIDRRNYSSEFEHVYKTYSDRKPIMLSEGAASYIDVRDNRDITNEAMIKLREFYTTIPRKYPRVKALFYWSKIDTNLGYFDLTKNQGILNVYKDVIQDPYYLSHMSETSPIYYENIGNVELNNGVEKISSFMKNYEPNINKVQYFIDGNQIGEATKRPFEITYDFSKLNKNNAKFKVVAYKDDELLIQREMDIKKGNTSINNEKDVEIYLNNNKLNLENKAIIKDGRTYIPVRKLVETSGGNINWDDTDKSFTIIKNGKSIKMSIGSKKAYVNGELVEIDAEPFIYENYSYLPIRIICEEVLEYKVDWNEKERKVILE